MPLNELQPFPPFFPGHDSRKGRGLPPANQQWLLLPFYFTLSAWKIKTTLFVYLLNLLKVFQVGQWRHARPFLLPSFINVCTDIVSWCDLRHPFHIFSPPVVLVSDFWICSCHEANLSLKFIQQLFASTASSLSWLEGHLHHAINFLSFIKEQIKFDPFLCNWWVLWFMSTQDNPDLWVWRGSNSHRNPSLQKPPNVDALCHLPFSSKIAQTSLTMLDNLRLKLKFPSDIISNREACTSWAMRLMQI